MEDRYPALRQLAELFGLETSFYDGLGVLRVAEPEVIIEALKSMGAELEGPDDAPQALAARQRSRAEQAVEPVAVAWDGVLSRLPVQLSEGSNPRLDLRVICEDGGEFRAEFDWERQEAGETREACGTRYQQRYLSLSPRLPFGYHRGVLEGGGARYEFTILSSPQTAYAGEAEAGSWGVFLPLYALRTRRSWGCGDFSDLSAFIAWLQEKGASFCGTLPLFASFLDYPFDPSPYAPVSRLYWNELYVDPERAPGWNPGSPARRLFESADFQQAMERLRNEPEVDYREVIQHKGAILRRLAQDCFGGSTGRLDRIRDFTRSDPEVERYGEFRAVLERQRRPWFDWPERLQQGKFEAEDFSPADRDYHIYCQWLASLQMKELLSSCREKDFGLYLDLPLGVHPDGFDAWRFADSFAQGCAGGAPPDGFFTEGQNWGFRPLDPEAVRSTAYRYPRAVIERMMASTHLIRIDHAMSLQRLYWIPHGYRADQGLYVRYPMNELFALLILESHRHQCRIVGEDLGTVDPRLREKMQQHGLFRMYVGQFEISEWPPVNPAPVEVVASLNTHDTPTAAGFWYGEDIADRLEMGLLDPDSSTSERVGRMRIRDAFQRFFEVAGDGEDPEVLFEVLERWLLHLAESPAAYLLVNLEDLWLERRPQNIPGTGPERPNWKRKARLFFEQFRDDPRMLSILARIEQARSSRRIEAR